MNRFKSETKNWLSHCNCFIHPETEDFNNSCNWYKKHLTRRHFSDIYRSLLCSAVKAPCNCHEWLYSWPTMHWFHCSAPVMGRRQIKLATVGHRILKSSYIHCVVENFPIFFDNILLTLPHWHHTVKQCMLIVNQFFQFLL